MIKPAKLNKGDTVATVSLSWGGASELPHRYQAGKRQFQDTFGVNVIEMHNTLKPAKWLQENPQARADDLHEALTNPNVKAIISNIGGSDSIRLLPYIDFDLIQKNPKIFLGFSDSTITHFMFYKAGVTSFYGTSLLVGFSENGGMHDYVIEDIKRTLFSSKPVGQIQPSTAWTSEWLEWENPELATKKRMMTQSRGWRWLNGQSKQQGKAVGKVTGELLGGCIEVLEFMKDTALWVQPADWQGKILFIETSEDQPSPTFFRYWLRNYVASGIIGRIRGIIVGRPEDNKFWREYDEVLLDVICNEAGLSHLPIITGMDFGHSSPTFTLPLGVKAQIDCDNQTFSIIESGVSN